MKPSLMTHMVAGGAAARNPLSFPLEDSVRLILQRVVGGAL